eukprot:RCo011701
MPKLRILCLHGSSQDKEIFAQRIQELRHKARHCAELVFADAPHLLPLQPGQQVAMREWWHKEHPEGRQRYVGWSPGSLQSLQQFWTLSGPFDGLLGFSQGGSVAIMLALLAAQRCSPFGTARFLLVAGACLPCPRASLEVRRQWFPEVDWVSVDRCPVEMPSLHFIGHHDEVVPEELSLTASRCFSGAEVHRHPFRHSFPQRADHIAACLAFLLRQQQQQQQPSEPLLPAVSSSKLPFSGAGIPSAPACENLTPNGTAARDDWDSALVPDESAYEAVRAQQKEELDALTAIYPEAELSLVRGEVPPFVVEVRVHCGDEDPAPAVVRLRLGFPPGYPASSPILVKP